MKRDRINEKGKMDHNSKLFDTDFLYTTKKLIMKGIKNIPCGRIKHRRPVDKETKLQIIVLFENIPHIKKDIVIKSNDV